MPRTKKDVVTEFRTAEILRAANRVFAQQGFDQATMAEIARVAGVAKGTIYLYYPSKQDIYSAALRRRAAELAALTKAAMAQATGAGDKVRAFIETTLRYFEEHREFFRISYSEVGRTLGRHDMHARPADDPSVEQVKALEQVLQQARRHKAIRAVRAEAAAFAILDISRGVVLHRLRAAGRVPLEEDIAFAFDLAWKGIGHR
jgi:AcrR family transcriptional regulator